METLEKVTGVTTGLDTIFDILRYFLRKNRKCSMKMYTTFVTDQYQPSV